MISIEELERQHDVALQNKDDATKRAREAGVRLYDARVLEYTATLAARGITVGTKVSVDGKIAGFAGFETGGWHPSEPVSLFTKVKQDGTVGKQKIYIHNPRLNDIKPEA